jgi:beta-galactosidase
VEKPSLTRRSLLQGGAIGTAAAALATLAGSHDRAAAATDGVRSYDFNQHWLFGGPYVTGAEQPGYDDGRFDKITLPHTVTNLSWTGWDYAAWENLWIYRKHFDGASVAGGRVLVAFDGVMTNATVVLNGKMAGSHVGGYLPWTTELTPHLAQGDNVLAVIVDARWLDVPPDAEAGGPPTMDYLQPGGIYRDVALRVVPEIYLEDVFARPENVLRADRSIAVQATVNAATVPAGKTATITVSLLDGLRVLATARNTLPITKTGTSTARLTIGKIGTVDYWSPSHPKLYTVMTTLTYPGKEHTVTTTIGFREAVFKEDGFYLNGSRFKIFGLNRHQLFPYLGMAAPARLQKRDAQILKEELNCTMVRCSHYPQSPHFLDACDELGIMVWQETPGWGHVGDAAFQQEVLRNVRDMVVRDRNRPSVVVWGTRLDETKDYQALYKQARQIAYAYDGSRQTSGAMAFRSKAGWAEDVYSYDDYRIIHGEPDLYPPIEGVPYLVSESVGAAVNSTYRWTDPPRVLANQALAHAIVHDQAQADIRYAGLLAWAGFDYYSAAAGPTNWDTLRTPGVADTFRVPKPGAAIYQSQVHPATRPVPLPTFFWGSAFWDSATAPKGPGPGAMFATNCDRLEIYAGGAPLVTAYPDRKRFGHLAYPPVFADLTVRGALPDLAVEGYVGSTLVATLFMSADTSLDKLRLTADDTTITADGSDATRITVRATDVYGNHRPGVTGDVAFSVAGPGVFVGRNPFPFGTAGGVGGAFIRSIAGLPGSVTVTARHATLGSASTVISVTTARSASYV